MMIDKRLVNFVPEAKKFVFLTVLLRVAALLSSTAFIFCAGKIVKVISEAECAFSSIHKVLFVMLGCLLVTIFANLLSSYTSFRASSKVKFSLRREIYEKLLRLGTDYQSHTTTAKLVQLAVEGVEQIETWFSAFLPQFYYAMIAAVLTFGAIALLDLKMALVLLSCVPLIPISMAVVQNIAKKILGKYWAQYANLADSFLENLQGLTTLQIYEADGFKAAQMAGEAETFRRVTMKVLSMQLNSIIIMDVIAYGGAALGIAVALSDFYAGSLSLSRAFVCILLSADFFIPLRRLGSAFHTAMNGVTASKNIFELLDIEEQGAPLTSFGSGFSGFRANRAPLLRNGYAAPTIPSADGVQEITSNETGESVISSDRRESRNLDFSIPLRFSRNDSVPMQSSQNDIIFQTKNLSVTFASPDSAESTRTALKNCDITIPRGSFVAFVGKSGSGKSTAAKVLSGIYKKYTGSALVCGTELNSVSPAALHDFVTYISHRDWIFAGTVSDCLREGKENATESEMKSALKSVNLLDFIEENGGLSFALGEGGSNLSGGQKQRLSIARALLHQSEVYIFDEATSNIDVESEQVILDLIHSLKGTKTVIMISHRAENCAGADMVYSFENGTVAEIPKQVRNDMETQNDRHAELVSASINGEARK